MFFLKKLDFWLLAAVFVLVFIGLMMIYSLGTTRTENLKYFWRQLAWLFLGIFLFFILSLIDFRAFSTHPLFLTASYAAVFLLLVLVLIFGKTISGNRAWFAIGSFTLQPVEFAKVVLILYLAKYFSEKNIEIWRVRHIFISAAIVGVIVFLVLLQPDWGSALVLLGIWFFMLLASGARTKQILFIILLFTILGLFSWQFLLTNQQKQRVLSVVGSQKDPLGVSYSQNQALIALGSGGFWGKGLGKGTQTQLGFLPAPRTDFIFASIGEELGFLGVAAVLASFGVIFWRLFILALTGMNNFVRLFSLGYLSWLFVEVVIHTGMNLGILPVIGISLPFVSYGGSHLLALFMGLGIVNSIQIYSK
jgi:rod shape determining protein RodA